MVRSALNLLFVLLATTGTRAFAAEVLRVGSSQRIIAISHDDGRKWTAQDKVCILQGGKEIACGTVVKTTPKGAIVKLDTANEEIARGDIVRSAGTSLSSSRNYGGRKLQPMRQADSVRYEDDPPPPPPSNRKPALALLNSVEKDSNSDIYHWNVGGGLSAGLSFFFPLLRLERALTPNVSVALIPSYFRATTDNASVGAFSGFVTGNFYGAEYFRGLWIQGGAGMYFFSTDTSGVQDSSNSFAFLGTGGWRGYWDFGLNIGVGGGFQFISDPGIKNVDIKSTGFQPTVVLDVGFSF